MKTVTSLKDDGIANQIQLMEKRQSVQDMWQQIAHLEKEKEDEEMRPIAELSSEIL